jgi:hypothetical protein
LHFEVVQGNLVAVVQEAGLLDVADEVDELEQREVVLEQEELVPEDQDVEEVQVQFLFQKRV